MRQVISDAIERIDGVETRDDLAREIINIRNVLDVDHAVFHAVNHDGGQYAAASYPMEWQAHYERENLLRVDPVIQAGRIAFNPVDWKSLDWSSRPARRLLSDAIDVGVGNQGLSLPIRGPNGQFAILTVSKSVGDAEWSKTLSRISGEILYLSHVINRKAIEILGTSDPHALIVLSPRELDVMSYLSQGVNRDQAAHAMGISVHTLRVYLESASNKLGANNTNHAVAKAVSLGFVSI